MQEEKRFFRTVCILAIPAALQSLLQNFCRRISLTAQAFLRAMCVGCEIFTGLMKMTKRSSVWR